MSNRGNGNGLKIISLQAENVKRIKAVEIRPDPEKGLVVISGKNGAGKSSILDSIAYALGGQKLIPDRPIREGQKQAHVTIDQASDSERMRISTALAMALNPQLKVIYVKHGNDLDPDSLKALAEMTDQAGYQVWMETVSSDKRLGIHIEDGTVYHTAESEEVKEQESAKSS